MRNINRAIAGVFAGAGALLLIHNGYISEGAILLATMLSFFVGEQNGKTNVTTKIVSELTLKLQEALREIEESGKRQG